jgi:Homeodomain-like domain
MSKQAPHKKYHVTLTAEERTLLQDLVACGATAARTLTHARILLKADESAEGPGWQDREICTALDVGTATVARVRQRFVEASLEAALHRRAPQRDYGHLVDGACEAHLVALACSPAPEGQKRWTLRMLADKLVELAYIETISHETVRQVLKKTNSSPG